MIPHSAPQLGVARADGDDHRQKDQPVIGQQTVEVPRPRVAGLRFCSRLTARRRLKR